VIIFFDSHGYGTLARSIEKDRFRRKRTCVSNRDVLASSLRIDRGMACEVKSTRGCTEYRVDSWKDIGGFEFLAEAENQCKGPGFGAAYRTIASPRPPAAPSAPQH